jgi:hypothetical protein
MWKIEIEWIDGSFIRVGGVFSTAEAAHWKAAKWRQKFGRSTHAGDPFRITEVTDPEAIAYHEAKHGAAF